MPSTISRSRKRLYQPGGDPVLSGVFPLFPYAMKAMTYLTGSYLLSAILLNNGFLYGAMWYLYRMGCRYYGRGTAFRAAKYISLFPLALFFRNPYTESLFLLLSVASIYYAMEGKLPLSGILGLLCALCRSTGVILMLPIFMEGSVPGAWGRFPLPGGSMDPSAPCGNRGLSLPQLCCGGKPVPVSDLSEGALVQRVCLLSPQPGYHHPPFATERGGRPNPFFGLPSLWPSCCLAGCWPRGDGSCIPPILPMPSRDSISCCPKPGCCRAPAILWDWPFPFYILGRWAEKPLVDSAVTLLSVLGLFAITWLFASGIPIY